MQPHHMRPHIPTLAQASPAPSHTLGCTRTNVTGWLPTPASEAAFPLTKQNDNVSACPTSGLHRSCREPRRARMPHPNPAGDKTNCLGMSLMGTKAHSHRNTHTQYPRSTEGGGNLRLHVSAPKRRNISGPVIWFWRMGGW